MYWLMLSAFFLCQLIVLLLDAYQMRREQLEFTDRDPLRWRSLLFMVTVTGFFLLIQLTGGWLVPKPLQIMQFVQGTLIDWTGRTGGQPVTGWMTVFLGVSLFYLAGLWDYIVHRFFGHSRQFWVTHEYHHLPNQVSTWMPGILVRPYSFISVGLSTLGTVITFYALLIAFRLPLFGLKPLLPILLIVVLVNTISHSCFLRRQWWVHRMMRCAFLTSPQEHLLHHSVQNHRNYGTFTTLWDRLWGTYVDPSNFDLDDLRLGLPYDRDFLGALTLGKLQLTQNQRHKYQVSRFCNVDEPRGTR